MSSVWIKNRWWAVMAAVLVFFIGCGAEQTLDVPDIIIKTSYVTLSTEEFSEELDLKQAAYPYNIKNDPIEYNQMVIDLVKVLSEEIVLLSAAAEKQIGISEEELEKAVIEFKKDYPEDSFEQILMTNAISYPVWYKRFEKNMIIDKLIDLELRKKIEITSQDIVEFYKLNQAQMSQADETRESQNVLENINKEKELIMRLRHEKTVAYYDEWITLLRQQHPVQIDEIKLKTFLLE